MEKVFNSETSQISAALHRVFNGGLKFSSIGNPNTDKTFFFTKGAKKALPYIQLSAGEKSAFDLLLDLHMKVKNFKHTVYCIDEPESHMNTALQGALLAELYNLIPDETQIWIATHSIGMMRKAKDLYEQTPQDVCFIDMSGQNFDFPTIIEPTQPTRRFWRGVLTVALDDLSELIVPKNIVVCEGNPLTISTARNQEHDAICYGNIFKDDTIDVDFVAAGSSTDVKTDRMAIMSTIQKIAKGINVIPVIDRDDHSEAETKKLESQGYRILKRRNIQSYLYDDEVLDALCDKQGFSEKKSDVKEIKNACIKESIDAGHPPDDFKKSSGKFIQKIKPLIKLYQQGNDAYEIERSVLSLLIKRGMRTYEELREDIFGNSIV